VLKCYKLFDSSFHGGNDDRPSSNITSGSIGYQVDPNWYQDTSAMDHITSDLDRISFHERYHGHENVQVGNRASLHIADIGQSSICTSVDKTLALRNILHVPHITKKSQFYS
jgi:hypothetical protein